MSEKFQIAIFTSIITLTSSTVGYWISSAQHADNMAFREKAFLVERRYDIYTTYMKAVNQSWAQYRDGNVDGNLRQKGIDAYEDIRAVSSPELQQKADALNAYFSELYPPYEIDDDKTVAFNNAFNDFKVEANKAFTF